MDTWMITGGAGYIGAHIMRAMRDAGFDTVVVDDLSSGIAERVPGDVPLVVAPIQDRALMARVMREHEVTGVIHLAAKKAVAESVERPLFYFDENVGGLVQLLFAMDDAGVNNIIYSSSASVYGSPQDGYVTEHSATHPVSPYGQTKVAGEWLVRDAAKARALAGRALSQISLRYFNVAGAGSPDLGDTSVANLIPMVFRALGAGTVPEIFGTDYATPDGTCIRDYVHVVDLAKAHVAAAKACQSADPGETKLTLNVGTGEGTSVREVMRVVREVTGIDFVPREVGRRPGDPALLVARADLIANVLEWCPHFGLREIVSSAWAAWCRP